MFRREHEFRIEPGGTFAANHDPRTMRAVFSASIALVRRHLPASSSCRANTRVRNGSAVKSQSGRAN